MLLYTQWVLPTFFGIQKVKSQRFAYVVFFEKLTHSTRRCYIASPKPSMFCCIYQVLLKIFFVLKFALYEGNRKLNMRTEPPFWPLNPFMIDRFKSHHLVWKKSSLFRFSRCTNFPVTIRKNVGALSEIFFKVKQGIAGDAISFYLCFCILL